MARPMYASFLPSITCSSCGAEIEISRMGDHLCSGPGEDTNSHSSRTDHDRIPSTSLKPPGEASSLAPPSFETKPPAHPVPPPPPQPARDVDRARRPSEATTTSVSASSDASSLRPSMALSMRKPSSEMALPQDSPFPLFPTKKSIARQKVPNKLDLEGDDNANDTSPPLPSAPLNGQSSSGATVLRRMNTIAPGPFHARGRKEMDKPNPQSSFSSTSPSQDNEEAINESSQIEGQPPQRPPRPKTDDSLVDKLQSSAKGSLQTNFFAAPPPPLPNPPAELLQSKPHLPSTSVDSSVSTSGTRPSIPNFAQTDSTPLAHRPNSTTESDSSTGSPSMSEYRSTSSRSSEGPMVSSASSEFPYKTSVDQNVYGDQSIASVLNQAPSKEQPAPPPALSNKSPVINQPENERSRGSSVVRKVDTGIEARSEGPAVMQESPIVWSSPTSDQFAEGEQRLSSLRYDPTAANGKAAGPELDLRQKASIRKPRPKVKGDCRGCGTPIVGKSLKAADGKLSGRWHKECFVCKTCKSKFQSADFYVLNDHPYCARHYHEMNRSLCQQCNTGIEGKYLETQPSHKYHVDCFTCQDCRKPLTRDYFEMNNSFYCEADAYRVWQKSKMLTPGRRFPERRTTKLMNMS